MTSTKFPILTNENIGAFSKGDKIVDWEITFLAFMKSAATYLRDEEKLAKAVELYKTGSTDFASGEK